jgi:hypothetical protein
MSGLSDVIVPDVVGEVVGWRAWTVGGTDRLPILRSVTHSGTYWHAARWTLATCDGALVCKREWDRITRRRRAALAGQQILDPGYELQTAADVVAEMDEPHGPTIPGVGCTCGLYAAKTREQLVKRLGYQREHGTKAVFIGEVGMAGRIIEGDQGWRAEKGRVKRLYVPFHHWRYVEPIAELYGVPVILDNTNSVEPVLGEEV